MIVAAPRVIYSVFIYKYLKIANIIYLLLPASPAALLNCKKKAIIKNYEKLL